MFLKMLTEVVLKYETSVVRIDEAEGRASRGSEPSGDT